MPDVMFALPFAFVKAYVLDGVTLLKMLRCSKVVC